MPRPPAPTIAFKHSRCIREQCGNLVYLHRWMVICRAHEEKHHYEDRVALFWADSCKEYRKGWSS